MKITVRAFLILLLLAGMMLLVNCSPYSCRVTFGASTCPGGSGSGGGTGGGGGGGGGLTAFLFAVDKSGTIDGYTLNTGAGTFGFTSGYTAPVIAANTGGVGMVVAQQKFLYAGIADASLIYGYTVSSSGLLTAIATTSAPFLSDFVGGVGQAQMITNPAGTLLFVSDTLQSQIYVYTIGTGGVLTTVVGSPFPTPSGFEPMNLATDGLGLYLYAINGVNATHTGSQIAAFTIGTGASLGVLTAVPGSPFNNAMWLVKGEPTGQFLIGTSGKTVFFDGVDDDNLYVFSITQSGASAGAITQIATVPTTNAPFSIAVQSNTGGNLVYSFSFNDTATAFNPIEGYTISNTGSLTQDSSSPFSNVVNGSWGQFDESGQLLFDYSLDPSTNIATIGALEVASTGALTEPSAATLNLATPGFWVVTDAQ